MNRMKCGVQLYTLRKYLKDENGIRKAFGKVKEMGAETVQVSGMAPIDAKVLKTIASDNHMHICGTHSPFKRIVNDLNRLAEEHILYGAGVIGLGMMPAEYRNRNRIGEFIDIANNAAEKLKSYDLKFAYHNHAFEFKKLDNTCIYDMLIDNTENVNFIIDTYWVRAANKSLEEYINKLNGRISIIHLKDYKKRLFRSIKCEVGTGELDFNKIMSMSYNSGCKYAVIEQDHSPDPYKSLDISMSYLKTNYMK